MKLFQTYEIGSLAKPPWLTATTRGEKINEQSIAEMEKWAKKLGIQDYTSLREVLSNPSRPDRGRVRDWASVFALRFFESLDLDIIYDGEAKRIEMYEYPARRISGFQFLGHVRSFDNKYYRKAAIVAPVSSKAPYHLDEFKFAKKFSHRPLKVPMTGPYTLADWSYNEYYQSQRSFNVADLRKLKLDAKRELVVELARNVIRPNIVALVDAGASWIQIDEPAATTRADEIPIFVEGINEATHGINTKFSVHICFSDYSVLYPEVLEMKNCSHFAWEFANRDDIARSGYSSLKLFAEHNDNREVGLGVVDVHNDPVETPELIRDRILYAVKVLEDPARIFVNPDCGLRTRTWDVAYAKLKSMVRGAELARKTLTGSSF